MIGLEAQQLKNIFNVIGADGKPLMNPNDQYTYNYGGNSQPLDFILTSGNMLTLDPKVEAIHINTDYMWQVADHDPVIAQFTIKAEDKN